MALDAKCRAHVYRGWPCSQLTLAGQNPGPHHRLFMCGFMKMLIQRTNLQKKLEYLQQQKVSEVCKYIARKTSQLVLR